MHSPTLAPQALLPAAAAPLAEIVDDLAPEHLGLGTPCTQYDVRGLLHHLLFWGPTLDGCGRKELVPPPAAAESDLDLVTGDWRVAVREQIAAHVAAWSDPSAWEGTTSMDGSHPLPARMVGGMVVGELVVHGWDLGRAVGRRPGWTGGVLEFLLAEVRATAETGRRLGVYGAEVAVPPTAPLLDQVLGTTGRSPGWAAPGR
jgi:uncharacterized protein (TIGR03086 family)